MSRPPTLRTAPPAAVAATSAPPARARRRHTVPAAVLSAAVLVTPVVAGCDLRLESPAAATPTLDAVQQARQRAAQDAVELADAGVAALAGLAAAGSAPGPADPEATASWLQQVVDVSGDHLDALGGVWVPFPSATAEPTPTPVAVQDVLDLLGGAAADARADAAATTDAPMARLLASVAVSRALLAERLAAAAGLAADAVTPAAPEDVPAGLSAADVADLIASHDALGYAWEVVAGRADDGARGVETTLAAEHRAAAAAWAAAAQVTGTGLDPRRAAYDLPTTLLDPGSDAAARRSAATALEQRLCELYAGLVEAADPGARAPLVAGLEATARTVAGLTAAVPAFPGLAEAVAD